MKALPAAWTEKQREKCLDLGKAAAKEMHDLGYPGRKVYSRKFCHEKWSDKKASVFSELNLKKAADREACGDYFRSCCGDNSMFPQAILMYLRYDGYISKGMFY